MNNKLMGNESNIIFCEDENNNTKVEVRLLDEDVWLNVNAIASLFHVQRSDIVKHIIMMKKKKNAQLAGNRRVFRKNEIKHIKNLLEGVVLHC